MPLSKLSILLVLFIVISSCKKDSEKDKKPIDLVRSALTTSGIAYDNAIPDSWIKITAEEYNNLLTVVTQAVTSGATEPFMNMLPDNGWGMRVTTGGDAIVARVPASSYIIAWSIKTGILPSSSTGSKLKVSALQKSGYANYGTPLPDIGSIPANTRVYFVIKQPSTLTPPSPSYTAVYNFSEYFLGTLPGNPQYTANDDSNILGPSYAFSSFYQVISTIKKPY